jgi:hypothetical protein
VNGAGCPLGFLLLQSTHDGEEGAKERYIRQFLDHFKKSWSIEPIIILSDKDWSEINALRACFPNAAIQLCFWHVLRAIKKRLATLRRRPAFYDVDEAQAEFGDAIDKTFVPQGQAQPGTTMVDLFTESAGIEQH